MWTGWVLLGGGIQADMPGLSSDQKLSEQLHRPLQDCCQALASLFKITSTWIPVPL